jgi:hypothetical protein
VDPQLPDSMGRLTVSGIRVGDQSLVVSVDRGQVSVESSGDLTIVRAARPPLTAAFDPLEG